MLSRDCSGTPFHGHAGRATEPVSSKLLDARSHPRNEVSHARSTIGCFARGSVLGGYIFTPTGAGWSVTIDEDAAAKHPYVPEPSISNRERDGSVADW